MRGGPVLHTIVAMRGPCARLVLCVLAACAADDPPAEPSFPGLTDEVEIVVDRLGIPHVYGATDADVVYGAGYAMATDRLFQMDLALRRAEGRRAEVLGEGYLDDDKIARLVDFARWARTDLEIMRRERPDDYGLLLAWTAGVNARIEEVRAGAAPLPYGFGPGELDYLPEPWEVGDGITVGVMLVFGNDETMQNELLATVLRNQLPELLDTLPLLRPLHDTFAVPEEGRPRTTAAPLPPRVPADVAAPPLPMSREEASRALARFRDVMREYDVGGSNNWAVHGSLTANGRPLIAGDPHQPLDSPSLFYAQHLNSADRGGSLDVVGWSFVGAPAVHIGHNRHVAWTATSNYGDVVDIWEVRREPDAVRLGGESLPLTERSEIIRARRRAEDGGLLDEWREVGYRVEEVGDGYGVLLDDSIVPSALVTTRPGTALLLRWTGFEGTGMGSGWLAMNRARSLDELDEAVSSLRCGSFNFVAADRDDILYRVGLDVPDRGDPTSRPMPWTVADGDDPATVWTGEHLSPAQIPHARNPARGWIATANNDPWGFTADGSVEDDPWYYGAFFAVGLRARRIEDELGRLAESGGVTVEDMQTLQLDTHSLLADDLVPMVRAAWEHAQTDEALVEYRGREDLEALVGVLTDWSRRMDRGEAGAVVLHLTALFAASRVLSDDFDFVFDTILDASTTWILKAAVLAMKGAYPESERIVDEGADAALLGALASTAELLTDRYGGVDPSLYTWGEVHGTRFDNTFGGRLDYGFVPTDGGEDTVNVSGSRFIRGGRVADRFESGSGAIYRMVASFAEDGTPEALANFPIGNSGEPDSPHWDDMVEDWANGVYHPIPFRRADVDDAAESRTVLAP